MFDLFLVLLIAQRLTELALARRNEESMRALGAVEVAHGHYRWAILLHAGFFVALAAEVYGFHRQPAKWAWVPLVLFLASQILRYWAMRTLGPYWNTKILVLPGARRIAVGPYRWLRHPNYLAVVVELAAIPLVFQAYLTAVVFSVLNGLFLAVRIPAENRALEQLEDETPRLHLQ